MAGGNKIDPDPGFSSIKGFSWLLSMRLVKTVMLTDDKAMKHMIHNRPRVVAASLKSDLAAVRVPPLRDGTAPPSSPPPLMTLVVCFVRVPAGQSLTLVCFHAYCSQGVVDVFEGTCDSLNHVGMWVNKKRLLSVSDFIPDFIVNTGGTVEWSSEVGKIYFILVRGLNDQGSFDFELSEVGEVSLSETGCQNADNNFVVGSTLRATTDEETLVCENYENARRLRLDSQGFGMTWFRKRAEMVFGHQLAAT